MPPLRALAGLATLCTFGTCLVAADAHRLPVRPIAAPPAAVAAPAVPLNVVFLGDSVTDGAGASALDRAFASLVIDRLNASGVDAREQRIISAFGGIYTDLVQGSTVPADASLIVVELGAHSVIENQSMAPATYRRGYGLLLDCLLASGAPVVAGTVPSLAWKTSDPLYWRAVGVSWIIAAEATARGIPVADIWNATRERPDLVSADGMHPGDAGHRVIAETYAEAIARAEASPPRPTAACPYTRDTVAALLR